MTIIRLTCDFEGGGGVTRDIVLNHITISPNFDWNLLKKIPYFMKEYGDFYDEIQCYINRTGRKIIKGTISQIYYGVKIWLWETNETVLNKMALQDIELVLGLGAVAGLGYVAYKLTNNPIADEASKEIQCQIKGTYTDAYGNEVPCYEVKKYTSCVANKVILPNPNTGNFEICGEYAYTPKAQAWMKSIYDPKIIDKFLVDDSYKFIDAIGWDKRNYGRFDLSKDVGSKPLSTLRIIEKQTTNCTAPQIKSNGLYTTCYGDLSQSASNWINMLYTQGISVRVDNDGYLRGILDGHIVRLFSLTSDQQIGLHQNYWYYIYLLLLLITIMNIPEVITSRSYNKRYCQWCIAVQ